MAHKCRDEGRMGTFFGTRTESTKKEKKGGMRSVHMLYVGIQRKKGTRKPPQTTQGKKPGQRVTYGGKNVQHSEPAQVKQTTHPNSKWEERETKR